MTLVMITRQLYATDKGFLCVIETKDAWAFIVIRYGNANYATLITKNVRQALRKAAVAIC